MGLVRLRATNTHLYPGARMTLAGADRRPRRGDEVLVEFADMGTARGRVGSIRGDAIELDLGSHRTQRGTTVAAKRWVVEPLAGGDAGWRVARRAPDPR